MKNKFILSLTLAAAMLSGCNGDTAQDPSSAEGEGSESYNASLTETVSESEPEAENADQEETEAEQAETESTVHIAAFDTGLPIKTGLIDLDSIMQEFDPEAVGYDSSLEFINEDICVQTGYFKNKNNSVSMFFYSTSDWTIKKAVTVPEGWKGIDSVAPGSGDVLCRAVIYKFDENYDNVYAVMTVYNDFEYELSDYAPQTLAVDNNGHMMFREDGGIYSLDENGRSKNILSVTGNGQWYVYVCPIDENRFVFNRIDISDPYAMADRYVGMYDFETDKAVEFPDARGCYSIGVHDGKIYSYNHTSRLETEIYVTDIETMETSFFSLPPFGADNGETAYYAMPESGDYILIVQCGESSSKIPVVAYIMDTETSEILTSYDIPEDVPFRYYAFCDVQILNKKTAVLFCSHDRKMFIFDIEY